MDPVTTPQTTPSSTAVAEPNTPTQSAQPLDWTPYVPKGSEKSFEAFKGKDVGEIFKSYVEKDKMVGGSIRLPGEKDTPEQRQAKLDDIANKMGRPETPDKYDLGELPKVSDTWKWDDAKLADAKAAMHKAGFTSEQAKVAVKLFGDQLAGLMGDPKASADEYKAQLVEHYGSEAMYNRNLTAAQKAVTQFGDSEFVQWFEQTGLGNHPSFIKFVAKIGRELNESSSQGDGKDTSMTSVADAQKQLDSIMNDKQDLYHSRLGTPGREARIEEVLDLHRIIAGEA